MAEIIQTVSKNTNPDKFKKSTIRKYDWVSLCADGFLYGYKKEDDNVWYGEKYENVDVAEKGDIWKMVDGCKSTRERTQGFRTKKELQEAIADGTAFRIRIKKKLTKVTTPTKVSKEIIPESSSSDGVPIWVWFVVGIVAVVVISNLTK
tara:strand:- start:54 stop:500 length:447 start_codon:yes stop_codon:yes gene_type:complete